MPVSAAEGPRRMGTPKPAICLWIIGGSSDDPSRRCVGMVTPEGGWSGFVRDLLLRSEALGYPRRHLLANPFGALPGQDMQLDQCPEAQAAGLTWLTRGFPEALRPVTDWMEVIAYLGTQSNDPDFLKLRRGRWSADDYLRRVERSLRPLLDAGCSGCWDAIFGQKIGTVEYQTAMLVDALARDGAARLPYARRWDYHEPPARLDAPEWWDKPGIITEQLYQRRDATWHPDLARISGEYIRSLNVPYGGRAGWEGAERWVPDFMRECWLLGQTPMADFSQFVGRGVPFAKLMEGTAL